MNKIEPCPSRNLNLTNKGDQQKTHTGGMGRTEEKKNDCTVGLFYIQPRGRTPSPALFTSIHSIHSISPRSPLRNHARPSVCMRAGEKFPFCFARRIARKVPGVTPCNTCEPRWRRVTTLGNEFLEREDGKRGCRNG